MRIIKCDKCGMEIQEDKDRLYKVYKDNGEAPVTFDYCDTCYPQLAAWIMTKSTFSTADTPMSERQILERFEKWYISVGNRAVRDNKFCVFHNDELYTPYSAIDEFLKEEGIEE